MAGAEPRHVSEGLAAARQALREAPAPAEPFELSNPDEVAEARRLAYAEARRAAWARLVPRRFLSASVDGFVESVVAEVDAWAAGPPVNLVLLGPVGVGKTHLALGACRPFVDQGLAMRFLPVVELLDLLRPGGPEGALYDLASLDLLVIDDLGSERATDWTAERLFALINRQWMEERRMVVTSNLAPDELAAAVGERTYSRLIGSGAVVLKLTGKDRRRANPAA